uniref:Uncharacterized protein n=1 Tax=Romanomermis culicivorax TaxID=13658 RepID=A0A915JCG5_ROMCU
MSTAAAPTLPSETSTLANFKGSNAAINANWSKSMELIENITTLNAALFYHSQAIHKNECLIYCSPICFLGGVDDPLATALLTAEPLAAAAEVLPSILAAKFLRTEGVDDGDAAW